MALYHKHRPQTFASVVGQEHIIQTLTNQILADKVAHAYLFSGPRGVGKTTTARLLAKAMVCEKRKKAEPCNTCTACTEIGESRSIDIIEIDAASHTGVDNVRENIIENAQFKPTTLPYKIFIIDEVHMLSTSAFNALLKTLEEPPAHVLFILATTEPHKLPDTIISRCQRFTYKKVPHDTMKKHIKAVAKAEGVSVEDDVLERIVNKGDGCVRDAVSLLDQLMATGEKKITSDMAALVLPTSNVEETLRFVRALMDKHAADALATLSTLAEDGVHFPQFATDVLELLRAMMIVGATGNFGSSGLDFGKDVQKELQSLVSATNQATLICLMDMTFARKREIPMAPIPQLPLEMLVIEWCGGNNSSQLTINNSQSAESPVVHETKAVTKQETATKIERVETVSEEKPASVDIKEVAEPPKKKVVGGTLAFDDVKAKWNDVLLAVEESLKSLVFILRMAELTGVEGNAIKLTVPYSFHMDKLMDKKCYTDLCETITTVLGSNVELAITVNKEQRRDTTQDGELNELAAAFGGEVI